MRCSCAGGSGGSIQARSKGTSAAAAEAAAAAAGPSVLSEKVDGYGQIFVKMRDGKKIRKETDGRSPGFQSWQVLL